MTNFKFWAADTAVRALKTFAQALVALFGANAVDLLKTDWTVDLSVAAGAALVSLLQNVSSLPMPKEPAVTASDVKVAIADAAHKDAQAVMAGSLYDKGGTLPSGVNTVTNNTGAPEPVGPAPVVPSPVVPPAV